MEYLLFYAAAAAKSLQLCPTLCDPIDSSPPGSAIPGILQARTLEWVVISFSNAWKWKVKVKLLSCVRFFATPWTAAYQAPPSIGFSRQEYWSGVPLFYEPQPIKFLSPDIQWNKWEPLGLVGIHPPLPDLSLGSVLDYWISLWIKISWVPYVWMIYLSHILRPSSGEHIC